MLKEQKRLEMVIVEKQAQMDAQAIETERLKKMNKVLSQQMIRNIFNITPPQYVYII